MINKIFRTSWLLAAVLSFAVMVGCTNPQASAPGVTNQNNEEMRFSKRFTNADFYTNGVFNEDVAMKAMREMLDFYGVPWTPFMEENFWVADFGLGDFENVGMGGIFWVNNAEHGYFAHGIYLLPGQMIPEHAHVATEHPAKFESWKVVHGWAYNFSEVGEPTPNPPAIPASHGPVRSQNFIIQKPGEITHLREVGTFHFLKAGPEGAIIEEWANYHDNAGLRFTSNAQL